MTPYAARLDGLRRLAASDEVANRLEAGERQAIGELWRRRAEGELGAANTFSALHRDCLALGVSSSISELTERAVHDERFHGELSLLMAEHYRGAPVKRPVPAEAASSFESCAAEVAPALNFVLHCTLNETIAVAYLKECYREARSALVRAAVRELLRDEIEHSRVGWAYLATTASHPTVRQSLRCEVPRLLALVSEAWCKPSASALAPSGHGSLSDSATRAVAQEAVRTLLLPGLARFGIEALRSAAQKTLTAPPASPAR